jgi:hypothetical protein
MSNTNTYTPEQHREALIERYIELRVQTRMYDAKSSTSMEEEFDHCYRHGCPNPETMTNQELLAEIRACNPEGDDE